MLISLYVVIIYECILSVFMEGKFLLVFLVFLVNCQNFYGVSSSVKSLTLQFDTIGQLMRLLACNPLLFLLFAMLDLVKCSKEVSGLL